MRQVHKEQKHSFSEYFVLKHLAIPFLSIIVPTNQLPRTLTPLMCALSCPISNFKISQYHTYQSKDPICESLLSMRW